MEASTAADAGAWRDGKRWLWLLSPLLPFMALVFLLLTARSGAGLWLWALPAFFYGLIPLLDWLIGEDPVNAPEAAVASLDRDRYYRLIVCAYVPSQYAVTVFGAWLAVTADLAAWELAGALITVGMVNGVGINTAHELGHKTTGWERWMAKLTLAPVAYGHFFIEHNKGHHKNVATPGDPASSRMGETFWAFLPRTVIGSVRSAWRIEAARLERLGKSAWSIDNDNLQAWALTVVLFGAITAWLGWLALPFLVLQAAFGASLLEVVNYIEHYGLLRRTLADGRYERCQPCHSWNSNHIVTNLFLYQLQRHSDHHANPTRRYQGLRHFEDSPQLPSGYAALLLVAYLPPVWFALMDRRVVAHHRGDLRDAHLQPSRRAALLARYPVPSSAVRGVPSPDDAPAPGGDLATPAGTTRFQCGNCGWIYDEAQGCPAEGFAAGTRWIEIPPTWSCPDCAVRDKPDFRPLD